jgi:hypothetical protein
VISPTSSELKIVLVTRPKVSTDGHDAGPLTGRPIFQTPNLSAQRTMDKTMSHEEFFCLNYDAYKKEDEGKERLQLSQTNLTR